MSLVSKPGRVCVGPLCPLFSRSMAYTLEHWTQNTLCLLGHLPAWRLWNCQNTKCFLSFDCETELHFESVSSLMLFHGIFQARILGWVAISFSRGSSWPRDRTRVSHIVGRCFTA